MPTKIINSHQKYSEAFGKRLKAAIALIGLSNEELKECSGVSIAQWSKYQRGLAEPGVTKIQFLFDHGISPTWLYTGNGPIMISEYGTLDSELISQLQDPETQTLVKGILLGLKSGKNELSKNKGE